MALQSQTTMTRPALLNSFFYKCFNANSPPLPNIPPNLQPSDYPSKLLCYEAEVFDLILSLDPTKSTGPDGISIKMLKGTIDAIVPSLTRLFNLSLSTGTFPNSWKLAHIVPVPKSGDSADPTNYRPISILSVVSKLLECHVHQATLLISQHPPPSISPAVGFSTREVYCVCTSLRYPWLAPAAQIRKWHV